VGRVWDYHSVGKAEKSERNGKEKKKKNKTSRVPDRKGNRPCINPSHFQSEKWQPPASRGRNIRYLHARVYVSWDASGQPPGLFPTAGY